MLESILRYQPGRGGSGNPEDDYDLRTSVNTSVQEIIACSNSVDVLRQTAVKTGWSADAAGITTYSAYHSARCTAPSSEA